MSDSNSNIELTEKELENIIESFENDRRFVSKQLGYDSDADMNLELLKTFQTQIVENQKIAKRLREQKRYHLLCKSKFDSDSKVAQYHQTIWQELNKIETGQ